MCISHKLTLAHLLNNFIHFVTENCRYFVEVLYFSYLVFLLSMCIQLLKSKVHVVNFIV